MTELETDETAPSPPAFDALTVNVYTVPTTSPVTVAVVVPVVAVNPPGLLVTV